jgi:hypothetical protein
VVVLVIVIVVVGLFDLGRLLLGLGRPAAQHPLGRASAALRVPGAEPAPADRCAG